VRASYHSCMDFNAAVSSFDSTCKTGLCSALIRRVGLGPFRISSGEFGKSDRASRTLSDGRNP
jgi:hypothetical protein